MKILTTSPPGTHEWKAAHEGKLGGHIIADILGVGRRSPLQAWAEITGKTEREDISKIPRVMRGVALEAVVASLFAQETGRELGDSPGLVQHSDVDWIALTPDRTITRYKEGEYEGVGLLEIKTAGFGMISEWRTAVPIATQVQLQFQLAVCEMNLGSAACMPIDDDEDTPLVFWQDLVKDEVFLHRAMDALTEFRERYWLKDVPPPATAKDGGVLSEIYPKEVFGSVIDMTDEQDVRWRTRKGIGQQIKELTATYDEIAAEMKAAMGSAHWMRGPGYVLRWQSSERKGYFVEPTVTRTLIQMKEIK